VWLNNINLTETHKVGILQAHLRQPRPHYNNFIKSSSKNSD